MFQLHDKTSRTAQLVDQLRSDILAGILAPGTRLKSMRDMAAELGVSKQVVESAYGELLKDGLVEKRPGPAGTCVRAAPAGDPGGSRSATLLLDALMFQHFTQDQRAYFSQTLIALLQFRLSAQGYSVRLVPVPADPATPFALPAGNSPFILYGRHVDRRVADYERQLARRRTGRYIFLDYPCEAPRAASFVNDHVGGGRLAAEHFLRTGRRRLAFAGCDDMPNHEARWVGFSSALQAAGHPLDCIVRWHSFDEVVRGIRAGRRKLDGIFFAADWLTIDVCNLLRREGIELQRDVALVSFDNTPALHHAGLEIPAVAADRAGMVDRAIAAIRDPSLFGVVTLDVALVPPVPGFRPD